MLISNGEREKTMDGICILQIYVSMRGYDTYELCFCTIVNINTDLSHEKEVPSVERLFAGLIPFHFGISLGI